MFDKDLLLEHINNIPQDITEQYGKVDQFRRQGARDRALKNAPSTRDAVASGDMDQIFLALDADKRFGRTPMDPNQRRRYSGENLKRDLFDPRTGKTWGKGLSKREQAYRQGYGTKEDLPDKEPETTSRFPDGFRPQPKPRTLDPKPYPAPGTPGHPGPIYIKPIKPAPAPGTPGHRGPININPKPYPAPGMGGPRYRTLPTLDPDTGEITPPKMIPIPPGARLAVPLRSR